MISRISDHDDTIVAIATPQGAGGIGIVRLSGPDANTMARLLLDRPLLPRRFSHRWAVDPASGQRVDEVMAVYLPAPATYTRQDVVEIHGHGGSAVLSRLLQLCVDAGARPAEPGEFTRRAFLGGRIDLSQAEAVADLIAARTEGSRRVALTQLEGGLSAQVAQLETDLLDALAQVEGALDFPEHDDMAADLGQRVRACAARARDELSGLLAGAEWGRVLREGMTVAIAGRPNVGKSSLLNALLRQERALVSPGPGTTRDTIEEGLDLEGIPAVLVDTAGLRHGSDDDVELLGMERTRGWLERADLILVVLDSQQQLNDDDLHILDAAAGRPAAAVLNKVDLGQPRIGAAQLAERALPVLEVSALTGQGLEGLRAHLRRQATAGAGSQTPLVSSLRHRLALQAAAGAVERFLAAPTDAPPELGAVDLREALAHLGEISGREAGPELLDRIFSTFCVGK